MPSPNVTARCLLATAYSLFLRVSLSSRPRVTQLRSNIHFFAEGLSPVPWTLFEPLQQLLGSVHIIGSVNIDKGESLGIQLANFF